MMQLTSSDIGKEFITVGGWVARIVHMRQEKTVNDDGAFEFLVIHKPGEKDEYFAPVWHTKTGVVKDKWRVDNNSQQLNVPTYDKHVADLEHPKV